MTPRENLLCAIRRNSPETVPFYFSFCPSLQRQFEEKTGSKSPEEYYDFPVRYVSLPPTRLTRDFKKYFQNFPENGTIDEWGVGYKPGSLEHFTTFLSPMKDFTEPEEVRAFPLPDVLADYRWDEVIRQTEEYHRRGLAVAYFALQIFEPAWYLRGLENLLSDMLTDEEMAAACLDRMTEIQTAVAARAAAAGVDVIVFGDDVATQRGMMMSREMWLKWLKPTMERAIAAAKAVNPQVLAVYHSDGVVYDIVEDLIGIGVDVLNPVQPECVDPARLKREYGDRLSFWGTVGTQTVMPFGTPEEVRETVRRMIADVGCGGGLVLAPTHMLEPEVPYENVEAFVSAVREFGRY